jgi:tetratricopeptide (TPR) repeat protein
VHTGEVVAGDPTAGQRLVTGDPVNTAARLEQAAPTNEILIGDLTHRLVRDTVEVEAVEPLELKGKAEPVPAYRLLAVRSDGGRQRTDGSPMVGREEEMALLRRAFDDAVANRLLRQVTVIGDAGVGKSRLVREALASLDGRAYVVRGRCLPYGRGITFWPIVEIVRVAAGIAEDDPPERAVTRLAGLVGDDAVVERLAAVTGLSPASFPLAESFWAVRRLVEILAEREPLVLVIDDIHWAEPTLLDLLSHVAEAGVTAPVLLLCTARHELLEGRPDWGEGPQRTRIALAPLGDAQAEAIVSALLGRSGLPAAILQRVVAAAEGNPLFVEQLVSMLVDDGVIRRVEGEWRLADELGEILVPPTIQALLAARLDRLGRDERACLEPASVIGAAFDGAALRALVPDTLRAELERHLRSLDRKQLVHPARGGEGEEDYRFHHILIRDTTYQGLLKRTRATLHERYVEWADERSAEVHRGRELEEVLGYHLEQAHRYLSELGPLDQHGLELGLRASVRLGDAGRRAYARGDIPATANLLQRAALLRPEGDPVRAELLVDAGEALIQAGELLPARETMETARHEARGIADRALETTAALGLLYLSYLTTGDTPEAEVIAEVEAAIPVLEAAGAQRALAQAWRILTNVHFAGCRYLDASQAAERMVEHAQRSGDRALELRLLPALATCAQLGPMPVEDAIGVCTAVLERIRSDRRSEAYTLRALANLEAMGGRFEEARSLYRRSRETLEQLGWRYDASLTSAVASGPVELIAGDAEAAERELRRDYETLAAIGEQNYIATTAAFLAEALYRQGRDEEALAMTERSEAIADTEDVATQYLWRSVRGKLLARGGRHREAESLAREAVAIIGRAQDPDSQGYAALDLAEVLAMGGRSDEAVAAAEDAAARFERKGNVASAARARALASKIAAGAPGPA